MQPLLFRLFKADQSDYLLPVDPQLEAEAVTALLLKPALPTPQTRLDFLAFALKQTYSVAKALLH